MSILNEDLWPKWRRESGIQFLEEANTQNLTEVIIKKPMNSDDVLVVIDMQRDFMPNDNFNKNSGRFAVSESRLIVQGICNMIMCAAELKATIIASRDYYPIGKHMYLPFVCFIFCYFCRLHVNTLFCADHTSFQDNKGPFPPHCVHGTQGSEFVDEIGQALEYALMHNHAKTFIVFKGMHENQDLFSAFPYQHKPLPL